MADEAKSTYHDVDNTVICALQLYSSGVAASVRATTLETETAVLGEFIKHVTVAYLNRPVPFISIIP